MADVNVDTKQLQEFFNRLRIAGKGNFRTAISTWFEAMGITLLDLVQDEIIRKKVVDTRLLLNSFQKGSEENTWKVADKGLTLEVGTNVKYAKYVNDGHWLNPSGVQKRFVPGSWDGDRFIYKKGAKTGMILKQKYIKGYHYWDSALIIFEKVFQASLDKKLQEWMIKYFNP